MSASAQPCIRHLLVVGGSGFVGSAVCRAALRHGLQVTSLSRSGRAGTGAAASPAAAEDWTRRVDWQTGDVLRRDGDWTALLRPPPAAASSRPPVDAVLCCVGGFGSVAHMQRVNGQANVNVLRQAALQPGVRRLALVSAFDYRLPELLKRGYIQGETRAAGETAGGTALQH